MKIIEFTHKISEKEVKSQYINLKDLNGKTYGEMFPERGSPLLFIDQKDTKRSFRAVMHKHNRNQIWGLRTWFKRNNIKPGTLIRIKYDPNEPLRYDSEKDKERHVVYFEIMSYPKQPEQESNENERVQNQMEKEELKILEFTELEDMSSFTLSSLLAYKKQLILYGPPGTGKTWLARNYIKAKTNDNREFYDFVTFHPSYSYEEFVEGLKPIPAGNGVNFVVEDGIFKRMAIKAMCEILKNQNDYPKLSKIAENLLKSLKEIEKGITATKNDVLGECSKLKKELWTNLISLDEKELKSLFKGSDQVREFYLAIDEINRGDISKIFGELITLLEADKRLGEENQFFVILPYSKEPFAVPPNLYIIGTMNTADRSIALIDVALRRRFGFIEVMPSYSVLLKELLDKEVESEKQAIDEIKRWVPNNLDEHDPWDIERLAIRVLYSINERIKKLYDKDHQIGHSYLLKLKEGKDVDSAIRTLRFIWYHEILPLLQEYFYDSPERLKEIIKDFVEVSDNYFEFKDFEKASDFWEELRKVAENK